MARTKKENKDLGLQITLTSGQLERAIREYAKHTLLLPEDMVRTAPVSIHRCRKLGKDYYSATIDMQIRNRMPEETKGYEGVRDPSLDPHMPCHECGYDTTRCVCGIK